VAPLVVFFRDLERAIKLVLRFMFYASPIIYSLVDLRDIGLERLGAINPFAGVVTLYRAAFFPEQLDWFAVGISAVITVALLIIGVLVFRRAISAVLKEI
jgi:ABC-2 type transport system permease protein